MRKLMAVALVLAVATTVGCTPGRDKEKEQARARERAAAARAGESPSPSASAPDPTDRVPAAVIPVDGLVAVGGPAGTDKQDENGPFRLARLCDVGLPPEWAAESSSLLRTWRNEKLWVSNLVFGHRDVAGAQVIEAVKGAYDTCKEYTVSGTRYSLVAPLQLGMLAGVEASYAWTERLTKDGDKGSVCEMYLSHGQLVSWVTVVATTMDTATRSCKQIATIAAAQLAKA